MKINNSSKGLEINGTELRSKGTCIDKDIIIPEGVKTINIAAFFECSSLENITLPEGLTTISMGAFEDCVNLKSIIIPSTVTSIRSSAFEGCRKLTSVYYNGTQTQWKNITIEDYGNSYFVNATITFANKAEINNNPIKEGKISVEKKDGECLEDVWDSTVKAQIAAVKEDPEFIKEIENPSETVQLAAIEEDAYCIQYIKNPSEAVQLAALEYDSETLLYIENPTKNVKLQAIDYDPSNIAYLKNPTAEVVLKAIEEDDEILEQLEGWLDDEDLPLDYSSDGLEEGLRMYAIDLLETGEQEKLFTICEILSNLPKEITSISTPDGIIFEEPVFTSLNEVLIYFLENIAKESGNDYYHFEDMYNYLTDDLDIFESMSKYNGVETLIKKCNSAGMYGSISPDYRYAATIVKIDFAAQNVAAMLQNLEEYIEENEIDAIFEHGMEDILAGNGRGFLLPSIIFNDSSIERIDYCVLKYNDDLFLVTFEYGE